MLLEKLMAFGEYRFITMFTGAHYKIPIYSFCSIRLLLLALLVASKEIDLGVNAQKTKYMFTSREQNAEHSHNIKTGNKFFDMVEQFKYLGKTITNQNFVREEINRRLNSENACYHLVQNLLSSSFPCKYMKIEIYKATILPVVLY
jgi:hypothetical protein